MFPSTGPAPSRAAGGRRRARRLRRPAALAAAALLALGAAACGPAGDGAVPGAAGDIGAELSERARAGLEKGREFYDSLPPLGDPGPGLDGSGASDGEPWPSGAERAPGAPAPAPPPPPADPAAPSVHAAAFRGMLAELPVKGRAPKTGYDRDLFGQRWSDDVPVAYGRNGCDTRNDILRRDLAEVQVKPGTNGCVALSGVLHDPYTGRDIPFTRGRGTSADVQIDHVVALADSWQKGAQQLGPDERRALANDPLNLLASDGPANQAKGAGDAATWLPANSAFRCRYVARQTAVKHRYRLWVTQAERDAVDRWLGTCTAADDAGLAALLAGAEAPRG
ncbi:HNH endonuclease family protein [Corynebacterium sp. 335C]